MGHVFVFSPEAKRYRSAFERFALRQDGLCWFCHQLVICGEVFVSHQNKKTKYYHEGCARKTMLL